MYVSVASAVKKSILTMGILSLAGMGALIKITFFAICLLCKTTYLLTYLGRSVLWACGQILEVLDNMVSHCREKKFPTGVIHICQCHWVTHDFGVRAAWSALLSG